jgi:hypothetical protein
MEEGGGGEKEEVRLAGRKDVYISRKVGFRASRKRSGM